jgi:hypothetical protein
VGAAVLLALSPAAGVFGVPAACARAGDVVEEQVARGAGAAPQPVGLERGEFLDQAAGQAGGDRVVAPYQVLAQAAVGGGEFDVGGAAVGERGDRRAIRGSPEKSDSAASTAS